MLGWGAPPRDAPRDQRRESVPYSVRAGRSSGRVRPGAPDIDAAEQKEPDHIDEVPVPGGELEAEVLGRLEVSRHGTDQADRQKDRPDDDVEAVEAGRHEEGRAVDVAFEVEGGVTVLVGLHTGERGA